MGDAQQPVIESKIGKFWKGFRDAFPVITGFASLFIAVVVAVYTFGSSQTASAAEIQKIKDKQAEMSNTINIKSDKRDNQIEQINDRMATKQDVDNLNKQIQLLREENKETRDLIYRMLENKR